jgi:hypothetical protein
MSFSIDVGIKYFVDKPDDTDRVEIVCYGDKYYFCFFHAVQRIMRGERIEQETYDCNDEYETPSVCEDCLTEEKNQ